MWIIKDVDGYSSTLPDNVIYNGKTVSVFTLTVEQLDEIGINGVVPIEREPFVEYEINLEKGDDFVYREIIINETYNDIAANTARIWDIKQELSALDVYLPRSVEGLVDSGQITLDEYNQQRYERKQELRTELATLTE